MNFSDPQLDYTDRDLFAFLGQQESQNIHWGDHFVEELLDSFAPDRPQVGATLPWWECQDLIRFRPGEVTVHAGMNGHRKSMLTGQLMMFFAFQGEACGVMSFEMPVRDTQRRMCQQAAGSAQPARDFAKRWAMWNHRHLAYYDKLDTTPSSRVLGAVFYMAKELGCRHIMIDSLAKCGLPYGERGAEKSFIDALCATAKAFQIHIHLVSHVRKPTNAGQEYIPNKFDVRGASELTDLVHNVIIHWADKRKESIRQRIAAGHTIPEKDQQYFDEKPDQRMIVEKQRNGAYEGTIGLNFHDSLQFFKGKLLQPKLPSAEQLEVTQ